MSRKLGVLVAIPIKGRKLVNRSGGKQSPYVQLKLGEDKKRTKASLIASVEPEWDQEVRFDVYQGHLDLHVMVIDEGKKNEVIGDGVLLLHEVIDKGELDVWFPIKYKGAPAGDIYFELTFYAAAPPPIAGGSPIPAQHMMHPPLRHNQPGFQVPGRPLPNTPYGPPAPLPGNTYRPYPIPQQLQQQQQHQHQQQPYPIPQSPANNASFRPPPPGPGFMNPTGPPPFRPTTQYNNASPQMAPSSVPNNFGSPRPIPGPRPGLGPGPGPGPGPGFSPHMPQPFPTGGNSYPPPGNMMPQPHPHPQLHSQPLPMGMPVPHPHGSRPPPNSYPNSAPSSYPNQGGPPPMPHPNLGRPPASGGPAPPVTPLMQYNYSLGSFP